MADKINYYEEDGATIDPATGRELGINIYDSGNAKGNGYEPDVERVRAPKSEYAIRNQVEEAGGSAPSEDAAPKQPKPVRPPAPKGESKEDLAKWAQKYHKQLQAESARIETDQIAKSSFEGKQWAAAQPQPTVIPADPPEPTGLHDFDAWANHRIASVKSPYGNGPPAPGISHSPYAERPVGPPMSGMQVGHATQVMPEQHPYPNAVMHVGKAVPVQPEVANPNVKVTVGKAVQVDPNRMADIWTKAGLNKATPEEMAEFSVMNSQIGKR